MYQYLRFSYSYFDYPLEQGLRQTSIQPIIAAIAYFDYPLEQGLRHKGCHTRLRNVYFDYPLEQGLRQRWLFCRRRCDEVF